MDTSEKDMERLLLQKRCHKNNFNCIDTSKRAHSIGTTTENYRKNLTQKLVPNILVKTRLVIAELWALKIAWTLDILTSFAYISVFQSSSTAYTFELRIFFDMAIWIKIEGNITL